jgi:DNA-binding response OmpR family regulator
MPMPRILLIDDDPSLLEVLSLAFETEGYAVLRAADGTAGLALVKKERPAAIVSDVNMPGLDGFSLCRRLREAGDHVPLILLTSRDNDIDETLGLELGADDYIAKPFNTRVLLARVAALLRREALRTAPPDSREAESERPVLIVGELALHPDRLEARWRGRAVTTTVTEFRLLEALARRRGIVMSRDRLLEIIRGDDSVVVERIIDTYVRRLRKKLVAIDPAFDAIETVVGVGYRYKSDG